MKELVNPTLFQPTRSSLVLVVDDDGGLRGLLRNTIEQAGYQVIEAEDGKQALETCQRLQPDIVLLDALMPTMDGITCCQKLCALYGDRIAVMMVTQLDDAESINRAFAAGAIDYVVKPIQPLVLRQKVQKMTQQAASMRRLHQANQELEQYTQFYNVALRERTAQFQRAVELEQVLERVISRACDALNEAQILKIAVKELASALKPIRCNAGLYEHDRQASSVCCEYTSSLKSYQNRVLKMDKLPEVYQQLIQGSPTHFCSIQLSILDGQTSMFVFPIRYEEHSVGDLWLVCEVNRVLDDLELRLAKQVAKQCAIAIQQVRSNRAFQDQIKELERLNQVKDDFLSTVSHELRSPVANIRIAAKILEQLVNRAKEEFGETVIQNPSLKKGLTYLQVIQSESDREIELINDLLDLQRLETGNQPINLTFIYLEEWIIDLMQPFQERARLHQQHLCLEIDSNLPPIESNPNSLSRVLTELIHNACKYTPPHEFIRIAIKFQSESNAVQISVLNTGVEISEDERDRIFEKFYRIPDGDRWKQGGTGLGLSLVKRLVENLRGSIQVESSSLQTRFTVQLPLKAGY